MKEDCESLAAHLGCCVEDRGTIIYVWPPRERYNWQAYGKSRKDPFEGDHRARTWPEVRVRLLAYERDLFFDRVGLGSEESRLVEALAEPNLLAACVDNPHDTVRLLVLADWLEENGHQDESKMLRELGVKM